MMILLFLVLILYAFDNYCYRTRRQTAVFLPPLNFTVVLPTIKVITLINNVKNSTNTVMKNIMTFGNSINAIKSNTVNARKNRYIPVIKKKCFIGLGLIHMPCFSRLSRLTT